MFPWLLWECCCRGLCCILLEPRKVIMGQQMWKWVGQPSYFRLFVMMVFPKYTFEKILCSSLWTILYWVFLVGLLIGSLPSPGCPSCVCIDFDDLCSLLHIVKKQTASALHPHSFWHYWTVWVGTLCPSCESWSIHATAHSTWSNLTNQHTEKKEQSLPRFL